MANKKIIPLKVVNAEVEMPRLLETLGSPQKVADHLGVSRGTVRNWFIEHGWQAETNIRHSVWVKPDRVEIVQ